MKHVIDVDAFNKNFRKFVKERNWDQFHNPKNLAMALNVEASELLEIFQWLSEKEANSTKDNPKIKEKISNELADIMIYLLRLADKININLNEAIINKMEINAKKYPVELAYGNRKKYNEYQEHE